MSPRRSRKSRPRQRCAADDVDELVLAAVVLEVLAGHDHRPALGRVRLAAVRAGCRFVVAVATAGGEAEDESRQGREKDCLRVHDNLAWESYRIQRRDSAPGSAHPEPNVTRPTHRKRERRYVATDHCRIFMPSSPNVRNATLSMSTLNR